MGAPASARPPGRGGATAAPGHTPRSPRATECGLTDARPGTLLESVQPLSLPHHTSSSQSLTSPPPSPSPHPPSPHRPSLPFPCSRSLFIPERQEVKVGEGRCEDRSRVRPCKGENRRIVGIRGGRAARGDGAWRGDAGRRGARAAGSAGHWRPGSDRPGWVPAGAAPTCAGRPQAQVAEVAQAAGLGLRGGFSITTSPAQERAGRGAAPGAAEARAGQRVGEGRHLGPDAGRGAGAPRRRHWWQPSGGPPPAGPSGLDESSGPKPLAGRHPCARVPRFQSAAPASADPRPARHRPPPRGLGLILCGPQGPGPAPRRGDSPRGWSGSGCGSARAAAARGGAPRRQPALLLRQHSVTSWWRSDEGTALVIIIALI